MYGKAEPSVCSDKHIYHACMNKYVCGYTHLASVASRKSAKRFAGTAVGNAGAKRFAGSALGNAGAK